MHAGLQYPSRGRHNRVLWHASWQLAPCVCRLQTLLGLEQTCPTQCQRSSCQMAAPTGRWPLCCEHMSHVLHPACRTCGNALSSSASLPACAGAAVENSCPWRARALGHPGRGPHSCIHGCPGCHPACPLWRCAPCTGCCHGQVLAPCVELKLELALGIQLAHMTACRLCRKGLVQLLSLWTYTM